jgi:hypothetical protein
MHTYTNFETALINTWYIAKVVYPDLFADIDIVEKTNEITEAFLGRNWLVRFLLVNQALEDIRKLKQHLFSNNHIGRC